MLDADWMRWAPVQEHIISLMYDFIHDSDEDRVKFVVVIVGPFAYRPVLFRT